MVTNPYVDRHLSDEMMHVGGEYTARAARDVVLGEYANGPAPVPCECGGTAHYKATVGVLICPDCGEMYHGNGEPV